MTLWLVFGVMALATVPFVVWRLRFPAPDEDSGTEDLAANRLLFEEKMAQLRGQLANGDIDDDQFHALELEFQRQFLDDNPRAGRQAVTAGGRWLVLAVALLVPLVAVMLYQQLGASPEMAARQLLEERAALFDAGKVESAEMASATEAVIRAMHGLAERRPDDPTYPVMLARLYADQGEMDKAIPQYLRATVLLPDHGDILAEYAQALYFQEGNRMTGDIESLVLKALQLSPHNQTALSLAGIASFQKEAFRDAIDYWNRALAMLPPGAPSGIALESGIAAARARLGETPAAPPPDAGAALTLSVSLGSDIQVPEDTTVFVYARAWQGAPMPLAIARLQVKDLPAEVVLTESMAMTPDMSLATVEQVEVVARVSLSGSAAPAPGDYQASAGPIEVQSQENPVSLPIISRIAE